MTIDFLSMFIGVSNFYEEREETFVLLEQGRNMCV